MSKIVIGGMRFTNKEDAINTIRHAIDSGFNYIDCAPAYCYEDEINNSEKWIGEAVNYKDYKNKVSLSAKCTPGNGGLGLGDFIKERGFGVRSKQQLKEVFNQSLNRMNTDHFEWYHLWTTHTMEQLNEARKTDGWLSGVLELKEKWNHLGITTHADSKTIIQFLETGLFEMVTLPLNIINTTRLEAVEYCQKNNIKVIAMNPLAGGFLANNKRLLELAFKYLLSLDGVYPLVGFSNPSEVDYAKKIFDDTISNPIDANDILKEVNGIINATEPRCTACGYCQPCPEDINVGASLSYYNIYKYMGLESAKKEFLNKQWEDGLRLDKCKACGLCESRCPNGLKVLDIIADAKKIMYK